ncbi:MAG: hypothetical protein RSA57_10000 [Cetobacterium sp.]|uniref:hypothetical protein n=1 Tax=unclassified Cetobacterium TaxID=2630983 RepID=UPI00163BC3B9|nr:hypothetical protein [Cetobacterium sp. 8H]MBC2850947.1 hypothetical protein [Cetobacterium sp. 8H]
MKNILKIIYTLLTLTGMIVTGNNTFVLRDMGERVQNLSSVPKVTSHSQININ